MKKLLPAVSGLIAVAIIAGIIYYSTACPCDRIPGISLSGEESSEQITDWQFANDVGLCQLQVSNGILPQSLNLNCMSGDGDLFVSCSRCDGKRWSSIALQQPNARVRIGERVYPVTLTKLTDPQRLDFAWQVRANKLRALGRETAANRPDHWWSFQLASRPAAP